MTTVSPGSIASVGTVGSTQYQTLPARTRYGSVASRPSLRAIRLLRAWPLGDSTIRHSQENSARAATRPELWAIIDPVRTNSFRAWHEPSLCRHYVRRRTAAWRSRMRTRKAVIWILSAALLALLPLDARAQAPEKRKVNIATASLGLPYLPLIIAQQRKYFADEGLEVEIAAFAGGSKALQSLMGGSSDVASGAYSNTLTMAAKGQTLKNFVVQVRYPALTIAVSKKVGDRYKSLQDLKGMKIGVSAPGSSTHMIVNHLLGNARVTSTDYSIICRGTSGAASAATETLAV